MDDGGGHGCYIGNNTDVDYLGDVGRYLNVNTVAGSASAFLSAGIFRHITDNYLSHEQVDTQSSKILSLI